MAASRDEALGNGTVLGKKVTMSVKPHFLA
jgi:hypothetical protein